MQLPYRSPNDDVVRQHLGASLPAEVVLNLLQAQDHAAIVIVIPNNDELLFNSREEPHFFYAFQLVDAGLLQGQVRRCLGANVDERSVVVCLEDDTLDLQTQGCCQFRGSSSEYSK